LQLVKKFPAFMGPESPSPYPQVPATCPYPEPTEQMKYIVCNVFKMLYKLQLY